MLASSQYQWNRFYVLLLRCSLCIMYANYVCSDGVFFGLLSFILKISTRLFNIRFRCIRERVCVFTAPVIVNIESINYDKVLSRQSSFIIWRMCTHTVLLTNQENRPRSPTIPSHAMSSHVENITKMSEYIKAMSWMSGAINFSTI